MQNSTNHHATPASILANDPRALAEVPYLAVNPWSEQLRRAAESRPEALIEVMELWLSEAEIEEISRVDT